MPQVQGLNGLNRQLSRLRNIQPTVIKAVKKENLRVQRDAVLMCPVNKSDLKQNIKVKTEATESMITGTTYTNTQYAMYVEFGTGPIGEANHAGISPKVTPVYRQHGWGIPADEISEEDAAKYHFRKEIWKGEERYMTSGQPAQPFMYPAMKNNEQVIRNSIARQLKDGIIKAVR